MLDATARFHAYSLGIPLLITLQAARLGFSLTRVAGFSTWKALGRSVVKGALGLVVLAPCKLHGQEHPKRPARRPPHARDGDRAGVGGDGRRRRRRRSVLCGLRVAHAFGISQSHGRHPGRGRTLALAVQRA